MTTQRKITDDLDVLLGILPSELVQAVHSANDYDNLIEIIMDLGRVPTARYTNGEVILNPHEITPAQIDHVVQRVGVFDSDNRAGLERTLHRISAIRNRLGHVVGLTCRVGRAVYGTLDILQDLIESGKNVLLLGRPGVGKTTLLREAARILAEKQRVVIVDTSNEIGGDGDVPHPAVGRARRMQVSQPSLQHEVMIEAVENHNPQVIVIDEIGRELEAAAARTIAERGVQLVGTAHGNTLENLLFNPTLSDLVGGIESVTLSDEEARRRGTQKTVLERRSPPTFDVLVEIQARDQMAIHPDVAESVDALLRGFQLSPEVRTRTAEGDVRVQKATPPPQHLPGNQGTRRQNGGATQRVSGSLPRGRAGIPQVAANSREQAAFEMSPSTLNESRPPHRTIRVYPYGVARNRLVQAAKRLGVPVLVVSDLGEAEVMVTLRAHYRKHERTIADAERDGKPIYVLRSNTVGQLVGFLGDLFQVQTSEELLAMEAALEEAQEAIELVLNGGDVVELAPASAAVRRQQHQMAREADLLSNSFGREPFRRVRIFRQ